MAAQQIINDHWQRVLEHGVSGGSDDDPAGGEPPGAPPAGGVTPPAPSAGDAPPVPTTPPPAPPKAGEPPAGEPPRQEPSDYEKRLRAENAEYRRRFEPYEKIAGQWDDETRAGYLRLGELLAVAQDPSNPEAMAEAQRIAAEAFGLEVPANAPPDPRTAPMTRAEFEEWQQSQQEEQVKEAALGEFVAAAEKVGIAPVDERGVPTPQWRTLMAYVQADLHVLQGRLEIDPLTPIPSTEEQIQAAFARMTAGLDDYAQQVRDDYKNGKGGARLPTPAGEPPSGESEIKTFEDARKAAMAHQSARPA